MNRDNPQLHDVYRLDLASGELAKEIANPGYAGWLADEDLQVRGAIAPLPDGSFDLLVRDSADQDWRPLLTIPAEDATSTDVVTFSEDGQSLLMISAAGSNTGRLARVDLATGAQAVITEDPDADVSGALVHPDTLEPQIVTILKERTEYVVLDPSVADDFKAVRALHPGDPSSPGATTRTRPGWSASPTTPGRSRTTCMTGRRSRRASFSSTSPRCRGMSWRPWSRSRSPRGTAWSCTGT